MLSSLLLSLSTLLVVTLASPIERSLLPNPVYVEPGISVSRAEIVSRITCPTAPVGKKLGGIVLLVHGTGSTGAESWASGPYVKVLPSTGRGYDVCYIDLPNRSLGDAQITAEYVVAAVRYLAPQSLTKKVSLIGHSQGSGLNIPWALEWWPSTKLLVTTFVSLAGDFHGTTQALFLCTPLTACAPSVRQQAVGSNYLFAQNFPAPGSAASALVTTTSIFTRYDEIVVPEGPTNAQASSALPGAGNYALQDFNVCGPAKFADHFTIIIDSAAFGIAKLALENPGRPAQIASFDRTYCAFIKEAPLASYAAIPPGLQSAFFDAVAVGAQELTGTRSEPILKPYVCNRGFAPPGYVCAA